MFNSPRKQLEELEQYRRKTNALSFIEGVLIGGLVGFSVGLLLAPQSGKETMFLMEEKTKDALDKGKGKLSFKGCCKKSTDEFTEPESDEIESEVVDAEDSDPDEEIEKMNQKY